MMATEQGTGALVKKLADEIIERLDKSYDLVYVDYRDQLTDTQVSALVRGDEWLDESWDFESESKYESAKREIDDLASDVIREWSDEADADLDFIRDAFRHSEEWDRVRFEIEERDDGSWVKRLVDLTPNVILRINVIDEDHGYAFQDVAPERVLVDLGVPLPATKANFETVEQVLLETSPEFSVLLGYWIVGADVSDLYELPGVDDVEIVNPYLYLGNPFTGSGFISERPLEATVRVKRDDLRTDKDAFGYSVDKIYGGLNPSSFEAKVQPATDAS